MFSQYGELRPTSSWDRLAGLGHPNTFQQVSRLGFVTAATVLNGSQPNFARCLAVCWAGILHIHFWRLLPPNRILPCAKFTLHPSLALSYFWQHYCMALEQWASAKPCGIQRGMELWNFRSSSFATEGATYILRAAITLGIGPHSSFV